MSGRTWRRIGFCLALAALAACGIKGEPAAPDKDTSQVTSQSAGS